MHIPKINLMNDQNEIISFMKRFSFGTIITAKNEFPVATHLPFVVIEKGDSIVLKSHFAKANDQWKDIENAKVLVVFSEPHAYISPKNYDKELNVPTWNYISVHAYGQGKIITDTDQVQQLLEESIDNFEVGFRQKWDHFPIDYKLKMANGIVAFEIIITDLQANKKLSQNKTDSEKEKIIETLSKSKETNEQWIAEYMKTSK
jgi:transcriptional regulator